MFNSIATNKPQRGIALFSSLLVIFSFAPLSAAELEKPKSASKEKTLDKQLRNSLDDDLFKDLPVAPKKNLDQDASAIPSLDKKDAATAPGKPKSALDNKLLDQLNEGEDVELKKTADPLTQIGNRMRKVEGLIQQRDTSRNTQEMQRQIATDLDSLIEQMQKQQKKSSGGKSGKSGQQSDASGAGNTKPTERPSESTQRVDKGTAKSDNAAELQKMIKEVWGHLPPRLREQMQNVTDEQFLPQYEKLIEEYYRRLAEQGERK